MMTAAEAASFRRVSRTEQGVEVVTLLTAGISNARRAGDPSESRTSSTTTFFVFLAASAGTGIVPFDGSELLPSVFLSYVFHHPGRLAA